MQNYYGLMLHQQQNRCRVCGKKVLMDPKEFREKHREMCAECRDEKPDDEDLERSRGMV